MALQCGEALARLSDISTEGKSAMRKHQYAKVGTLALASAGLLWAFKAAAIMITDTQQTAQASFRRKLTR
jgi:hypothetical protein